MEKLRHYTHMTTGSLKSRGAPRPRHFIDLPGTMGLAKGGPCGLFPSTESGGGRSYRTRASSSSLRPHPQPEIGFCRSAFILVSLFQQARPISVAAPRHLSPSRRVTVENFFWGPAGKGGTGSGGGRMGRANLGETLCEAGPQVCHSVGWEIFTWGTALAGPHCPAVTNPFTLL